MAIKLHVIPPEPVKLSLEEQKPIPLSIDLEHLDPFLGDYEVTPFYVVCQPQTDGSAVFSQ